MTGSGAGTGRAGAQVVRGQPGFHMIMNLSWSARSTSAI